MPDNSQPPPQRRSRQRRAANSSPPKGDGKPRADQPAITLERVVRERRARFNPLANLTPEKLGTQLEQFRAGHLRDLALTIDAIEERDDVLATVVPKAKAAPARHGFEVLTVDTASPGEAQLAARQKRTLEFFYNNLRVTSALDQDTRGGFALLVRQMMDAKSKRYSVHNIVWQPRPGGEYTATLWHVPLWFFENTEGRLRYLREPFATVGEPLDETNWLVSIGQGVGIASAVAWMFKHLPLRDWLAYCERHGMPGIEGVTDSPPGSEGWQRMVEAVRSAAREFAWVRSSTDSINKIDFAANGELPYPKLVERMDRSLATMWRGADLSTISSGGGSGFGASLQGHEARLIEQDDAQWISETLQIKLDRLVLDAVFGPDSPALAYVQIPSVDVRATELDLQIDEFALRNGHPVSRKQFAERYNRPLPEQQDAVLTSGAS